MRRLIKCLIVASVLGGSYWGLAAWALRQGFETWFQERVREGWHAEYEQLDTAGFPNRHITTIANPALADPGTGTAWSADWISFDSAALSPTHQNLRFAETAQRLSYFDQTLTLLAQGLVASLDLAPGTALSLQELSLASDAIALTDATNTTISAEALAFSMVESDAAATYDISGEITGFAPQGLLREQLLPALPAQVDRLALSATVEFDTEWDRRALELRRPQPRQISLNEAEGKWGPMRIRAIGALIIDEAGRAEGAITLQADHWREMLTLLEESGVLAAKTRSNLERLIAILAGRSGHPDKLEAKLGFSRGQMLLGPLPLGPAPRFILR